ncbi:MAG: hypothetical protein K9H64_14010 [Bacteroidales bacterium]|nr:hypothetical protein [Bacteroidales bacterium]
MKNLIKNTDFNNLVNYSSNKSSADFGILNNYNSVDPTSLSYLSKNSQIIEYHLLSISEKEISPK